MLFNFSRDHYPSILPCYFGNITYYSRRIQLGATHRRNVLEGRQALTLQGLFIDRDNVVMIILLFIYYLYLSQIRVVVLSILVLIIKVIYCNFSIPDHQIILTPYTASVKVYAFSAPVKELLLDLFRFMEANTSENNSGVGCFLKHSLRQTNDFRQK